MLTVLLMVVGLMVVADLVMELVGDLSDIAEEMGEDGQ